MAHNGEPYRHRPRASRPVQLNVPAAVEHFLAASRPVRIQAGTLQGITGPVIARRETTRLLVVVVAAEVELIEVSSRPKDPRTPALNKPHLLDGAQPRQKGGV